MHENYIMQIIIGAISPKGATSWLISSKLKTDKNIKNEL